MKHLRHPEAVRAELEARPVKPGRPFEPVFAIRICRRVPLEGRKTEARGTAKTRDEALARLDAILRGDREDRFDGGWIFQTWK